MDIDVTKIAVEGIKEGIRVGGPIVTVTGGFIWLIFMMIKEASKERAEERLIRQAEVSDTTKSLTEVSKQIKDVREDQKILFTKYINVMADNTSRVNKLSKSFDAFIKKSEDEEA